MASHHTVQAQKVILPSGFSPSVLDRDCCALIGQNREHTLWQEHAGASAAAAVEATPPYSGGEALIRYSHIH